MEQRPMIRILIRTTTVHGGEETEMRVVADDGIPPGGAIGPVDTYRHLEALFGNLAGETRIVVLYASSSIPGLYTEGGI